MQKQSILTIEGLKKNFGELSVLKQVDLKVDKGEVISIIGPSGTGKSTLTALFAGYVHESHEQTG